MTQTQDEGLLTRWARRKQQSTLVSEKEDLDLELQAQGIASPEVDRPDSDSSGESEVPVLTDADMPPIDTLTEESDFSGFMSGGVSDKLRNLALRKLFSAPSFNIRDGLDEYDEDYTYFEKLGDIVTSDMKHQMELEEAEKREQQMEEAAKEEKQPEDELAGQSTAEAAVAEEEDSDPGGTESKIKKGEEDTVASESQLSDADEPQDPGKHDAPETSEQDHVD